MDLHHIMEKFLILAEESQKDMMLDIPILIYQEEINN